MIDRTDNTNYPGVLNILQRLQDGSLDINLLVSVEHGDMNIDDAIDMIFKVHENHG